MKEKEFWEKIRPFIQKHTKYYERIENRVNQGTPDVFCLSKNLQPIWIELKTVKDLLQRPKFQPQQPIWHKIYASKDGNSIILVNCKDIVYAVKGSDVDSFFEENFVVENFTNIKNIDSFFAKLFSDLEN